MIFTDIVGIIADDLTGANDTALQFHLRGANTRILLDGEYIPQKNEETEVWALSTESRNIDEWEAVEKVERAVKSFLENFSFDYTGISAGRENYSWRLPSLKRCADWKN